MYRSRSYRKRKISQNATLRTYDHVRNYPSQRRATFPHRTNSLYYSWLLRTQRTLCRRKHPGRSTPRPIKSMERCAAATQHEAVDIAPSGHVGCHQLSACSSRPPAFRPSHKAIADADMNPRKHHVWQGALAVGGWISRSS